MIRLWLALQKNTWIVYTNLNGAIWNRPWLAFVVFSSFRHTHTTYNLKCQQINSPLGNIFLPETWYKLMNFSIFIFVLLTQYKCNGSWRLLYANMFICILYVWMVHCWLCDSIKYPTISASNLGYLSCLVRVISHLWLRRAIAMLSLDRDQTYHFEI